MIISPPLTAVITYACSDNREADRPHLRGHGHRDIGARRAKAPHHGLLGALLQHLRVCEQARSGETTLRLAMWSPWVLLKLNCAQATASVQAMMASVSI